MKLYYYTTVDKLALILHNKAIRFTRLDFFDDLKEAESFSKFNPLQYIFASCHTKDEKENIPLWKMYSSLNDGVRIEFNKDTMFQPQIRNCHIPANAYEESTYPPTRCTALTSEQIINPDYMTLSIGMRNINDDIITYRDVEYDDNFIEKYKNYLQISDRTKPDGRINRELSYSPFNFGFYKTTYWKFQEESRFLIYTFPFCPTTTDISRTISENTKLETKYIDVGLSNLSIENMKIRLAPNASKSTQLIVNALTKEYTKIVIEDSELKGHIR